MSSDRHDRARKRWTVAIEIDEHDGHTRAKARLGWRDQTAVGIGMARLDPDDRKVADIGDELAAARALADLARRMMAATKRMSRFRPIHSTCLFIVVQPYEAAARPFSRTTYARISAVAW